MKENNCLFCKKLFLYIDKGKKRKFCCHKCYASSLIGYTPKSPPPHKPAVYLLCPICSNLFKRKRKKQIFCSRLCAIKNYSLNSLDTRICIECKKPFSIRKSAVNKICSKTCHRNFVKKQIKEKHPSWKGGIKKDKDRRKSYDCVVWRKAVFERDNYTCQMCNKKGVRLEADHIKAYSMYPKLRHVLSNGRTLCKECHKKTDNYGAKARLKK